MHSPRKPWLIAVVIYVVGKMLDGVLGGVGEKLVAWLRTFIPADIVDWVMALGFWWGAGLVLLAWGAVEATSKPTQDVKTKHWLEAMKKRRAKTGDAPVLQVATYIYEQTGWEGGTKDVLDLIGREIADKLAARAVSGWVRHSLDQPLNEVGDNFWTNITIDVLGATVVKPHMHGGRGTYYDLRLSWDEVKHTWPSRYPALLLPFLQLVRLAPRMDRG